VATPLIDGSATTHYGDPGNNIVSLYGAYGNEETGTSSFPAVQHHYIQGNNLANLIKPLCTDGLEHGTGSCPDGRPKSIVFLFIGFSNCDIEVCGGHADVWDGQRAGHLEGQPCSTSCPNLGNLDNGPAWNQVPGDAKIQRSFLYQVYPDNDPNHWLVGSHVVVFNGALGDRTLNKWDPTSDGWYWTHNTCQDDPFTSLDPECEYYRVRTLLHTNGFGEGQVQAIFFKSSNPYPQCDLKGAYCAGGEPDAYISERHMGNILRYLKCCKLDAQHQSTGIPRYPNLKLVFLTTRIYGGYANAQKLSNGDISPHNCLMPEPFAYQTVTKL
jgi:hypothetical protein